MRTASLTGLSLLRYPSGKAFAVAAYLVASSIGCDKPQETEQTKPDTNLRQRETKLYAETDSMGVAFERHRTIPVATRDTLLENSGAAMSLDQPGVFFTINDSGHEAYLFALDTTGADRGAWRVTNARNVDWEAISLGPCTADVPRPISADHTSRCLYVGDVGDNEATRDSVTIYQVAEPVARSKGFAGTIKAVRRSFTYDDGPHDVEAMYVASDGSISLITKRALRTSGPPVRPALVFRIPATAWASRDRVVATLVDSLPIILESALQRMITDAALSPDGRWLAVRTYRQLYVMEVDRVTGMVAQSAPRVCNIFDLNELQGEGMTWVKPPTTLLLTSEGKNEPLHIIDCPVP